MQAVLNLGYSVIYSDLDAAWLRDFQKLAPKRLDVVLVDDSEVEEERRSDNTGTGMPQLSTDLLHGAGSPHLAPAGALEAALALDLPHKASELAQLQAEPDNA